jgi:translation initiation factor 4G
MTTLIRSAEPRDAEFLGWACVMASRSQLARGWFDVVLQRDDAFVQAFAKYLTLARAVSWWHWSLFRIAEVDGVPACAMCGFGDESVYMASGEAMAEASDRMGIDREEQAQHWPRGAFILSASTGEEGAWTIENVATRPAFRGMGVTQALLADQCDIAHGRGFSRAQISLFIGNARAQRAYEKAGFVFAEDKCAPDFEAALGVPGIRRLARDV